MEKDDEGPRDMVVPLVLGIHLFICWAPAKCLPLRSSLSDRWIPCRVLHTVSGHGRHSGSPGSWHCLELLHRSLRPLAPALTANLACPSAPTPSQEGKVPGQASAGTLPEEG